MARLTIKRDTLRNLSIKSKNQCAFPDCDHPLLNTGDQYIAELCHIEAANPGGERYNSNQTDEERRSIDNLLFLCHKHHKATDDILSFPVARLQEIKARHESLPDVVFNNDLLLQCIEEVQYEQHGILDMLQKATQETPSIENYAIRGPGFRERWTPESGRFYESTIDSEKWFRYMMKDGWLHIEHQFEAGAIAYYEIDKNGSVRDSKMPYPINQYRVEVDEELVVRKEKIPSSIGNHAVRTLLKWSLGAFTIHYINDAVAAIDCNARCRIEHSTRVIRIISPSSS